MEDRMSYKELRSYLYDMRVMALAEAANNDAVEWPRLCFELESAMAIFNLDDVLACFVDGEFMCEVDDLLDRYLTTYQLLRHSRAAGRAAAFGAGWRCAAGRG